MIIVHLNLYNVLKPVFTPRDENILRPIYQTTNIRRPTEPIDETHETRP